MLRKLLKHEFRATARVMLPLYLITILLALMSRATNFWTEMVTYNSLYAHDLLNVIAVIIAVGFVLALVATFVVAVVLAILRFRSNLMADEGYVMFTLPVSTHALVWSKLIVSAVWFLGAAVIDVLALVTLVADVQMFGEFARFCQDLAQEITAYYLGNGVAFILELLILFLVGCVVTCLTFYTPLAIGHSFNQHKMLLSVVFFFVIQVIVQIISGISLVTNVAHFDGLSRIFDSLTPAGAVHSVMWVSIAVSAIYAIILYCITIRMLHRRLNLE